MPDQFISRQTLSGLIPDPIAREIIKGATESSAVLRMGRRLPNMNAKQLTLNVLDSLPTAYFVNGDNGTKKLTQMAWDKKKITAEEILVHHIYAVIVEITAEICYVILNGMYHLALGPTTQRSILPDALGIVTEIIEGLSNVAVEGNMATSVGIDHRDKNKVRALRYGYKLIVLISCIVRSCFDKLY